MRTVVAVGPLLAIVLAGCAATIQDLTKTQYMNETFSADELREGGLALLPVTAGQGQEGYRRPLGTMLNAHLQEAVPGGRVLSWEASMDSLNANGLVADYQNAIESYQRTSILDRNAFSKFAEVLGVRFAMYCALQDFSESSKMSYNFLTGLRSSKTATVVAHCLIVDLVTGDVMQEIIGEAQSTAGDYEYNSPYEAYAATVATSVLQKLPGSSVVGKSTTRQSSSRRDSFRSDSRP